MAGPTPIPNEKELQWSETSSTTIGPTRPNSIKEAESGIPSKSTASTSSEPSSPTSPSSNVKENDAGPSEEQLERERERILFEQEQAKGEEKSPGILDLFRRKGSGPDPDSIATQPSVFDDEQMAKYFQPHPSYENLHRFDPKETWTWREEKGVLRRIDMRITIWACIAFFGLDLGRGNLAQANTDDFLPDLGLTTNDFNTGNTVYQLSFLAAELPSQMISKKLGPDRWIPFIMCAWSIVSGAQFFLTGRASFLATRALLGMLQGGFIPDVVLYLTYFFKGGELPIRLAVFWSVRRITDIIAPLLAFGVLRMRGILGYEGWRWLFLIEGLLMLMIGIWSWFMMAASPTQTKTWYRPKGWFSDRQEKILVNRILRDDPSKGDMHNRQAITLKLLWKAFCDFDMWPIFMVALVWEMPSGPPDQYLTLTLRRLGFDTFQANLLYIPAQAAAIVTLITMTWFSEKLNQRAFWGMFTQIWYFPCLVALITLPFPRTSWTEYAVVTTLLSYPSPHAIHVGWASRNSGSVRTRAVSTALYNMTVQLARVIYSNIYREDDEPEYRRGNRVLLAICVMNIFLYLGVKVYYVMRNRWKEKIWSAMTKEEKMDYLGSGKVQGNKRLDFRFVS